MGLPRNLAARITFLKPRTCRKLGVDGALAREGQVRSRVVPCVIETSNIADTCVFLRLSDLAAALELRIPERARST